MSIDYTSNQLEAIDKIVKWFNEDEQVFKLGGFAGTGKTTIISKIIDELNYKVVHVMTPTGKASSVLRFNANDSLSVRDPKTDFFKTIDNMIIAVEDHKNYPDSDSGRKRNIGTENAISTMDDLQDHLFRSHSIIGAQANTINIAKERTELLEISTKTLRSSVIDTDLAEASLKLTQLNLNYQAMLSTVGKVSKLSLVNYL